MTSSGSFWFALFPQWGPGRKHERKIELVDWQRQIVSEHPWEFLRGLIDSDGSRYDRVVNGKAYPAYEFKNRSTDILEIFCDIADRLAIHYTLPHRDSVSIATRRSVAILDLVIPAKDRPATAGALLLIDSLVGPISPRERYRCDLY